MGSEVWPFIAGVGSGLGGGVLAGLFGVGGAILLIPLLALLLRVDQHRAQGLALAALLLPNGLPAVLHYRSRGIPIHWGLVGLLTAGFLGGVWMGALLANRVPPLPLRYGFAAFLLFLALRSALAQDAPSGDVDSGTPLAYARVWPICVLIGMSGGLASGLLGIGGAVVMNPLMVSRLRLPQHQAQLTSLALMLAPIGLPGVIVYAQAQRGLPWGILAGLALGFMVGAYLGARLATRTHASRLRIVFSVLMVLMAILLLFRR